MDRAKINIFTVTTIVIALMTAWIMLAACSTKERIVETSTKATSIQNTDVRFTGSDASRWIEQNMTQVSGRHIVTDWKIYETRLPPDSATGKPPLLAEGTIVDQEDIDTQVTTKNSAHEVKVEVETDSTRTQTEESIDRTKEYEQDDPIAEASDLMQIIARILAIIVLILLIIANKNG